MQNERANFTLHFYIIGTVFSANYQELHTESHNYLHRSKILIIWHFTISTTQIRSYMRTLKHNFNFEKGFNSLSICIIKENQGLEQVLFFCSSSVKLKYFILILAFVQCQNWKKKVQFSVRQIYIFFSIFAWAPVRNPE